MQTPCNTMVAVNPIHAGFSGRPSRLFFDGYCTEGFVQADNFVLSFARRTSPRSRDYVARGLGLRVIGGNFNVVVDFRHHVVVSGPRMGAGAAVTVRPQAGIRPRCDAAFGRRAESQIP